ncbi:DUF6191 domain-containing protein [Georgenia subflava]|uniref:Uncharacterized protein n=1 Tax=Georgenia subflava TaxID=1622177 RepID=A0A6N7EK70_9MICO|nr:DUF6191 domain-containing protein [Georgenia subflava]MPV38460.1 hypothetical protein [Georgenia subflava]
MTELFEIFEPGLKHLNAERERQRHEVQIPGDAAPPFGIDLDDNVAYIERPVRPREPDEPET